ncbi:MAG: DUF3781 domain-containing protein [Methanosphaera stadtmanae]|nr:DUF3781 domain-containing protein [Methanosphaera stadtmanae]
MNYKNYLLSNVDKIHTTELGVQRIGKNLKIENQDVVEYCIKLIEDKNSIVTKKGKNFYVTVDNKELTVNSSSFTIITAHIKNRS